MASSSLTSAQGEKGKIEQIISEFFAKSLHVILESRIPYIYAQNHNADDLASHHSTVAAASTATTTGPGRGTGTMTSAMSSSPSSSSRSSNRWFNLEMDNCTAVLESVEPWRRGWSAEPMVVDVLLQQPMGGGGMVGDIPSPSLGAGPGPRYLRGTSLSRGGSGGDSWNGDNENCASPGGPSRTVLERWVVQYVPRQKGGGGGGKVVTGFGDGGVDVFGGNALNSKGGMGKGGAATGTAAGGAGGSGPPLPYPSSSHAVERAVVYKRTVIMLRSLYCSMRTLPAHRLFRLLNLSSHSRSFSLSYRVSASLPPLPETEEAAMMTRNLTPVETVWGKLCVSVAYRHTTAVTALEITPPILPKIIQDYVGSPTTVPSMVFPNVGSLPGGISGKIHVIPLRSNSVPNAPSGPLYPYRHSWSGGQQKFGAPAAAILGGGGAGGGAQTPPTPGAPPLSPFRGSRSPSPSQPPASSHSSSPSTTSGVNLPLGQSPRSSPSSHPAFPRPHTSSTSHLHHPPHHHDNHVGSDDSSSQPIPIHRDRGRSPSFSPSPSPSPPAPSSNFPFPLEGNLTRGRSAPVTIPPRYGYGKPGTSPRHISVECQPQVTANTSTSSRNKSQYPPPSPSRNVVDYLHRTASSGANPRPLLLEGESGGGHVLVVPTLEGGKAPQPLVLSTLAESQLFVSPPHPFYQAGEEKDEGPPSNLKRSHYVPPRLITPSPRGVRSSSQEEQDDGDEDDMPFAVSPDDDNYRSRMEKESAVGALVRILRAAPPLRHSSWATPITSGSPSPRPGIPPSVGGFPVGGPPRVVISRGRSGGSSLVGSPISQMSAGPGGKVSSKTSSSALDELRGYIEMRDHLRRQSGGGKFLSSSPGKLM